MSSRGVCSPFRPMTRAEDGKLPASQEPGRVGVGEPSGTQPWPRPPRNCHVPDPESYSREAVWRGKATVTSKRELRAPDPKVKNWLCQGFYHLGQVTTPLWVSVASSMKWR